MSGDRLVVGHNVRKVDGVKLVTGGAAFTDDVHIPGMLYGKILPSPHAHARIKRIDTSKAKALPGVHAVLTYKDVPRVPHTTAGQAWPEPSPYDTYLLDSKVRFVGDRVAAVAAESRAIAEQALKLIEVEYEVLPAVFDMEQAMAAGAPVIHDEPDSTKIYDREHNIAGYILREIGNVDEGFRESDYIFEREYPHAAPAALPHRTARHHRLAGCRQPAGDPHQHTGAVPLPPPGGDDSADPGEPRARDQAAHRRRLRRQAGDAAGGHLRSAGAGHAASREDRVHARGRVLHGAQPPSADPAHEDGGEARRHGDREPADGAGDHRRVRQPFHHRAGQHRKQGAAALPRAAHALRMPRGLHQRAGGRCVPRLRMSAGLLRAGDAGGRDRRRTGHRSAGFPPART